MSQLRASRLVASEMLQPVDAQSSRFFMLCLWHALHLIESTTCPGHLLDPAHIRPLCAVRLLDTSEVI